MLWYRLSSAPVDGPPSEPQEYSPEELGRMRPSARPLFRDTPRLLNRHKSKRKPNSLWRKAP